MSESIHDVAVFVFVICMIVLSIAFYFLPSIVAVHRNHHQSTAIVVLNLLTGWTFVGWVISLTWSLTATPPVRAQ